MNDNPQLQTEKKILPSNAAAAGGKTPAPAASSRGRNHGPDDFADVKDRASFYLYGEEAELIHKRVRAEGISVSGLTRRLVRNYFLERPYLSEAEVSLLRNCYRELNRMLASLDDTWKGVSRLIETGVVNERFKAVVENDQRLAGRIRPLRDRIGRILEQAESRDVLERASV